MNDSVLFRMLNFDSNNEMISEMLATVEDDWKELSDDQK